MKDEFSYYFVCMEGDKVQGTIMAKMHNTRKPHLQQIINSIAAKDKSAVIRSLTILTKEQYELLDDE